MQASDTQPRYPIRIAVRRTGLSPHVLRAWERRYGVVQPVRDAGGDRLYSEDDLVRLRLLRRLTEAGHAIRRLAPLPTRELALMADGEPGAAPPPVPTAGGAPSDRFVADALEALDELDAARLHATLMRAVVALPSDGFTGGVVLPLLHEVGVRWREGRMCPVHEHVLSAQVGRVLAWLAQSLPVAPGAPDAVAVAPRGHRHEFGALLASVVAAEEGWRVTYLGPDLPAADIATAVRVRGARAVLLSAVLADDPAALAAELRALRGQVGAGPALFVGGCAADTFAGEVRRAGATPLRDLGELRAALGNLLHGEGG